MHRIVSHAWFSPMVCNLDRDSMMKKKMVEYEEIMKQLGRIKK